MKLWRFSDPRNYEFAQAVRRGTWEGSPQQRVRPLVVAWQPGSNLIGDFTWPGFDSDIIVRDEVAKALKQASVRGYELGPVEMVASTTQATKNQPRVALPYHGPRLWDLFVAEWGEVDRDRSTLRPVGTGDGEQRLEVLGAEDWEQVWDADEGVLKEVHHQRNSAQGLVVSTRTDIFRLRETPAWIFCTEGVKALIEEHGFSNVRFLEMGDIIDKK